MHNFGSDNADRFKSFCIIHHTVSYERRGASHRLNGVSVNNNCYYPAIANTCIGLTFDMRTVLYPESMAYAFLKSLSTCSICVGMWQATNNVRMISSSVISISCVRCTCSYLSRVLH